MLDCHQHFWRLSRGDYGSMGEHVAPLLRDFLPDDLRPLMARTGITRTIVVQAAETLAVTYGEVCNAVRTLLAAHFGPGDMHRAFAGNGEAFYLTRSS